MYHSKASIILSYPFKPGNKLKEIFKTSDFFIFSRMQQKTFKTKVFTRLFIANFLNNLQLPQVSLYCNSSKYSADSKHYIRPQISVLVSINVTQLFEQTFLTLSKFYLQQKPKLLVSTAASSKQNNTVYTSMGVQSFITHKNTLLGFNEIN